MIIDINLTILSILILTTSISILIIFKQKKKIDELDNLLKYNKEKLEQLQLDFGQFAPQEVIEQLTDEKDG